MLLTPPGPNQSRTPRARSASLRRRSGIAHQKLNPARSTVIDELCRRAGITDQRARRRRHHAHRTNAARNAALLRVCVHPAKTEPTNSRS